MMYIYLLNSSRNWFRRGTEQYQNLRSTKKLFVLISSKSFILIFILKFLAKKLNKYRILLVLFNFVLENFYIERKPSL